MLRHSSAMASSRCFGARKRVQQLTRTSCGSESALDTASAPIKGFSRVGKCWARGATQRSAPVRNKTRAPVPSWCGVEVGAPGEYKLLIRLARAIRS